MTHPDPVKPDHLWENQSHHGSPLWYCECCGISGSVPQAKQPCPKRESYDQRMVQEAENKERAEYRELLRQRERFEYLQQVRRW